jgi:hypothetical protein
LQSDANWWLSSQLQGYWSQLLLKACCCCLHNSSCSLSAFGLSGCLTQLSTHQASNKKEKDKFCGRISMVSCCNRQVQDTTEQYTKYSECGKAWDASCHNIKTSMGMKHWTHQCMGDTSYWQTKK